MDTATPHSSTVPAEKAAPSLSPFQRMIAVFARPTRAWDGLETRAQWWFPLLVTLLFMVAFSVTLNQRAIVPMMQDQFEEQVANGQMSAEGAERMMEMMSSPVGLLAFTLVPQLLVITIMQFLIALVIWFGVSFILGTRFRYRLALEVACWAGLINIPGQILFAGLAWSRQTMRDIHIGFGLLLPESETPSKLMQGLGIVLDALGPFSLWYLAVAIVGAAALSGAPRKSVAWVLGGLYLVLVLLAAALSALFGRGA